MTTQLLDPRSDNEANSLTGGRLPRWAFLVIAITAAGSGLLLAAVSPVQGVAGTAIVGVMAYLVIQTLVSFGYEGRRHARDRLATTLVGTAFVLAVTPLTLILITVVRKGIGVLNLPFLSHSMRNITANQTGGGVYHGIVGTVEQVGIAAIIAVPLGILVAIYLSEYARGPLSRAVSFFVDVMTGVPSIVAGLFIYSGVVLLFGLDRIGAMGGLALALLMIPIVVRSTEEMLRLVPRDLREASYALGIPQWKTILRVVLPTAQNGIITGVMLAVARVAGETAPLLLTVFLSQSINFNPFSGAQASIPTFVWDQISSGTSPAVARAWAGALVLILLVVVLNLVARLLGRLSQVKG